MAYSCPSEHLPKLPERPQDSHKAHYGKVLIVGGSSGMAGAPMLAARAALRSGAGLVKVALPAEIYAAAAQIEPCVTCLLLHGSSAIAQLATAARLYDVVALGCGWGVGELQKQMLLELLALPAKPVVIDADGLNNLSLLKSWWRGIKADVVLTPHGGELKRLLDGGELNDVEGLVQNGRCILVDKRIPSSVRDSNRRYVRSSGNPGMATAGSGDVLTGIIAALIGQGLCCFDAAVLGVHLHGLAGDIAARRVGQASLIATDIIEHLPDAFRQLDQA